MTLTNAEREMLWAEGWNDLYDVCAKLGGGYLVDDAWSEVSLEACQGIIQTMAYEAGKRVRFRSTFCRGKPSVQFYFE